MILRVPSRQDGYPVLPLGTNFVVRERHDDGTVTVLITNEAASETTEGFIYRLGLTTEPRARRALQQQVEAHIDTLSGQDKAAAMAAYRGVS